MKKVRDCLWVWGHPEDSLYDWIGIPNKYVTPVESMRELGATNIFFVPFGHPFDIIRYSKDTKGMAKIGLSVENWGDLGSNHLEKTLSLAPLFPQIDRVVYDDFFGEGESSYIRFSASYPIEELISERERIHKAGLEMWVVYYQSQLNMTVQPHMDVFDGVSFWFWNEPTPEQYREYSQMFLANTVGKKRLIGCYLYNFGLKQPALPECVEYQLDANLELLKSGEIEGIVLHNNVISGCNHPAYEAACKWVETHGDKIV
ncbi:hypothetical protein [Cohnella zeiphila]|uniref:Uncharacterized protein n=1 Tax=Cohnella zeiphila TaxID=2761120 RepID=A0A7X0SJ11_9BACL|nr:hypothetical protein [Cohnella zeiphila]MBB6730876.1 hypothetical protein [Cohnella zeiphila]